jgi:hypothetical protein
LFCPFCASELFNSVENWNLGGFNPVEGRRFKVVRLLWRNIWVNEKRYP